MSNGWLTIVTSPWLCGSIPFFVSAAKSSYWLPQHQTPTFFRASCLMSVMPLSLWVSSVMPLRVKTWAMLTRSPPWSRVASRLGSQSIPSCACPLWTTCSGVMSGPPSFSVTLRH